MALINSTSPLSQLNIGQRVMTPAGPGTLDGVAETLKRNSTEIESVDALVFIDGIGRRAFDVREIAAEAMQQPVHTGTHYHKDWKGVL